MDILECIGYTPLIRLKKLSDQAGANIYVKLESRNPGSSIKDRAAYAYLKGAMARDEIKKGGTVVEATSGNLGIGLALVCAKMGLKLLLTMPDSVSQERIILLRAMGAELELTPHADGMSGAQAQAEKRHKEIPGAFRPNQFSNPDGPIIHYETTGPEIVRAARQQGFTVDAFVAGVGSGATISGIGCCLREVYPTIRLMAVEPAESPVLSGGQADSHGIQGIGAGFIPPVYNAAIIDEVLTVTTDEAIQYSRSLLQEEAVSCGISSGANALAALRLGSRPEFQGRNIVTVICDTGERYLSTPLFSQSTPSASVWPLNQEKMFHSPRKA